MRRTNHCRISLVMCCNTLQHPATLCSTLQHTATRCNISATQCNTLQHTTYSELPNQRSHVTRGSFFSASVSLQHTATYRNTLQHTATHCNTIQHTTIHWNTLLNLNYHLMQRRQQDKDFQKSMLTSHPCVLSISHRNWALHFSQKLHEIGGTSSFLEKNIA